MPVHHPECLGLPARAPVIGIPVVNLPERIPDNHQQARKRGGRERKEGGKQGRKRERFPKARAKARKASGKRKGERGKRSKERKGERQTAPNQKPKGAP